MVVILDLDLQRELNLEEFYDLFIQLKSEFKNNKINKKEFLREIDILIYKLVKDCNDLDIEKEARKELKSRSKNE